MRAENRHPEKQVVKMQKLRQAIQRIRRTQTSEQPSRAQGSWFKRLKKRLGLTPDSLPDKRG